MKIAGTTTKIYKHADLCSFASFTYIGNVDDDSFHSSCPISRAGHYQIISTFAVPKENKNSLRATPDFRIQFYDSSSEDLVGCTQSGTSAQIAWNRLRTTNGERALLLGMLSFLGIFGACLYMHKRKSKDDTPFGPAINSLRYHRWIKSRSKHNEELCCDIPNNESDTSTPEDAPTGSAFRAMTWHSVNRGEWNVSTTYEVINTWEYYLRLKVKNGRLKMDGLFYELVRVLCCARYLMYCSFWERCVINRFRSRIVCSYSLPHRRNTRVHIIK